MYCFVNERNVTVMGKFDGSARKCVLNIKPYIPGKPIEEVQREHGITNVVKLASNENPLGPSKLAVKAIREKLNDISQYPESGAFYLRRALAKQLKVKESTLMFGNGSNELLNLIALAFVEPGDEVMFSALSFVVYPIAADAAGGTAIQIPHKEFRHDLDGFIKRLSDRTKLVFLCNPNNPTGTIFKKAEFEKFMAAVNPRVIVVLDEAYFEYVQDKECPDGIKYLAKYPNLVVLRTFAKIYGLAGIRIGYGVADPDIVEIIERVRPPFNANLLAQYGAQAALRDKKHVAKTIRLNNEGKKYLYAEFKKLGIGFVPTQANFIFVKFASNSKTVFEELLMEGVIIRPQFDRFARITVGTMKQNIKLIKSLKKIL